MTCAKHLMLKKHIALDIAKDTLCCNNMTSDHVIKYVAVTRLAHSF